MGCNFVWLAHLSRLPSWAVSKLSNAMWAYPVALCSVGYLKRQVWFEGSESFPSYENFVSLSPPPEKSVITLFSSLPRSSVRRVFLNSKIDRGRDEKIATRERIQFQYSADEIHWRSLDTIFPLVVASHCLLLCKSEEKRNITQWDFSFFELLSSVFLVKEWMRGICAADSVAAAAGLIYWVVGFHGINGSYNRGLSSWFFKLVVTVGRQNCKILTGSTEQLLISRKAKEPLAMENVERAVL